MSLMDKLIGLLAPFDCLVCGTEGSLLCTWCEAEAILRLPSRCYNCNRISQDCRVCSNCRHQTPLKHVWVVTEYEGIAEQLIQHLKFQRAYAAADLLAAQLDATLPYLPPSTIISHVPTASARIRQRGYDQAALIAKTLARRRQLPYCSLLDRWGASRQVGANREQRQRQLEGAFHCRSKLDVTDGTVLLIDDVLTTGATLTAAAKIIKQAGAKQVNAAVIAQKR